MEELYIDGKKIEPIDEKDAEFTYLKGKYTAVRLGYHDEVFEVYIKDEDIKKMQEENFKPFWKVEPLGSLLKQSKLC